MNYIHYKMGLQNIKLKIAKEIYISLTKYFQKQDVWFLRNVVQNINDKELRDNFTTKPWNRINKINTY